MSIFKKILPDGILYPSASGIGGKCALARLCGNGLIHEPLWSTEFTTGSVIVCVFVSTNCWAGRNRYLNGASSRAANLRVRTTGQLLRTLLMAACRRADGMLGFNPIKRFGDSAETVDGTPFSAASQGHWNLS